MKKLTGLNHEAQFRLKVMDAYQKMEPKNVRYLCSLFGISKSCFYKWKARYNPRNISTLKTRSRRPKTLKTIDWDVVVEICEWKRNNPKKSHYYLYQLWLREIRQGKRENILCSPKTIYNWWKKRDLIINRHRRIRRKSKIFNSASVPGELVQIDTKFLEGRKRFQYTAIDVVSKFRVLRIYSKLNQENSIDFLKLVISKFSFHNIKILLIQTDNGLEFQTSFKDKVRQLNINHQHTWIHTPDQNGVVERSHRTDEEEFYQETDTRHLTTSELNNKLGIWEDYYNNDRLHFAIQFDTPKEHLEKFKVSTI